MTTQQAIDILRCKVDGDAVEALEMGIKALEWQEFVLNGDACSTCKYSELHASEHPCRFCVHIGLRDYYERMAGE